METQHNTNNADKESPTYFDQLAALPGWKVAIGYGLVTLTMLGLAVALYQSEVSRVAAEQREMFQNESRLRMISEKKFLLDEASDGLTLLAAQIGSLRVDEAEKQKLRGTLGNVRRSLKGAEMAIDGALRRFESGSRSSPNHQLGAIFSFVGTAYAQSGDSLPWQPRVGFALLAFILVIIVIVYCLWMIASPATPLGNRKFAMALLTNQLVFIGGLISGVIVRV